MGVYSYGTRPEQKTKLDEAERQKNQFRNTPYATRNTTDRMRELLTQSTGENCTRQKLANYLGASKEELDVAEDGGSIPDRWLLDMLFMVGANPFWLLTGIGPRHLHADYEGRKGHPLGDEQIANACIKIRNEHK